MVRDLVIVIFHAPSSFSCPGMALAPWNVLGAGKIRSDEEEERRKQTGEHGRGPADAWLRTPEQRQVCLALEKVAKEVGAKSITAVAIAYVMQKTPYVFPIIGGRKVEHFHANLEALDIALTPGHIAFLETILPFSKGVPYNVFVSGLRCGHPTSYSNVLQGDGDNYNVFYKSAGHSDKWPVQQAIRPSKE